MRIIHYIMGDPKIINENGLSVNSEIKKLPEDVSLHETKINFRIFDAKAYEALVQRISQASKDYGFIPNRSPTLKDGEILPQQYEPVPRHIFGKPIEDIDGITFDKVNNKNE